MIHFLFYNTPLFYLIQSLWRDEAFSFFMAKPGFIDIIKNTSQDFNPPLYYILLHIWIQIVGKSDEPLRILSFLFHIGTVYVSYLFARKLFSKNFSLFVAYFTFLNPMLLYYAFELRMYSLYALATLASFYFLFTRKWSKYIISTIIGLYTHSFFPLLVLSYVCMYRFIPHMKKKDIFKICFPLIFYVPWVFVLIRQFFASKDSWLFPVDLQLITSVLGNLFTSYEGTPGGWWFYTAILSFIILLFFIFLLRKNLKLGIVFLTPLFFPLCAILGYSILKRPLYVNRYMIFVTVFEVFALSYGIWCIPIPKLRRYTTLAWIFFVIFSNILISPYKKKTDFKTTFAEINKLAFPSDYVYAKTPIGFLESAYYFQNQKNVFVYNPDNISIPNYIGSNIVFPHSSRSSYPSSPSRTFLVDDYANFELLIRQ